MKVTVSFDLDIPDGLEFSYGGLSGALAAHLHGVAKETGATFTIDNFCAIRTVEAITLPRAAVERLVDSVNVDYMDWEYSRCAYCEASADVWNGDKTAHAADCPVQVIQKILAERPPQ